MIVKAYLISYKVHKLGLYGNGHTTSTRFVCFAIHVSTEHALYGLRSIAFNQIRNISLKSLPSNCYMNGFRSEFLQVASQFNPVKISIV